MPPDSPSPRFSTRFHLVYAGFWVLFVLVAMPVTGLGQWFKTGKFDLVNQLIWESGWIGWAPLSLLIFAICRRFPLERQHLFRTVARLALIGVGVVGLQWGLECVINTTLGMWLRDYDFDWKRLAFIATYKSHAYYIVYWMIVGVAHAAEFHRRYREGEVISSQLEAKLANAELERLKMQLQPHFLFNTHHAIVAMMLKKDNNGAIRMLTRLSDLLRLSLSRSGQPFVTLGEELELLQLYLEIQRERFRDRLVIEVSVPLELREAQVPHLLLQPLVENALQHGLEDVTENGRLEILIAREGKVLICEIRDNGAGFAEPNGTTPEKANTGGIGLANTKERLRQLYGENQSLAIQSAPGAGCAIMIRFPYRTAAVEMALLPS